MLYLVHFVRNEVHVFFTLRFVWAGKVRKPTDVKDSKMLRRASGVARFTTRIKDASSFTVLWFVSLWIEEFVVLIV